MKVDLDIKNFSDFAFFPHSEKLSKEDQKVALVATILLCLTFGIGHAICGIIYIVRSCNKAEKISQVGQERLNIPGTPPKEKVKSPSQSDSEISKTPLEPAEFSGIEEIPSVESNGALADLLNEFEEKINQCFTYFKDKSNGFKDFKAIVIKITFGTETHSFAEYYTNQGSLDKCQEKIPAYLEETYRLFIRLPVDEYQMEIKMWDDKDLFGMHRTLKTSLTQIEDADYVRNEGDFLEFSTFVPKELPAEVITEGGSI